MAFKIVRFSLVRTGTTSSGVLDQGWINKVSVVTVHFLAAEHVRDAFGALNGFFLYPEHYSDETFPHAAGPEFHRHALRSIAPATFDIARHMPARHDSQIASAAVKEEAQAPIVTPEIAGQEWVRYDPATRNRWLWSEAGTGNDRRLRTGHPGARSGPTVTVESIRWRSRQEGGGRSDA